MIAVFCIRDGDFDSINLRPKSQFKRIRTVDDIRGISFTGVIDFYDYYTERHMRDAYEILQERQPELFKEK